MAITILSIGIHPLLKYAVFVFVKGKPTTWLSISHFRPKIMYESSSVAHTTYKQSGCYRVARSREQALLPIPTGQEQNLYIFLIICTNSTPEDWLIPN